ncbi:RHS repeat domain-containing protein [Parabacteroides sp. FAFU027]|uniref:RHS repeat domain-containing protein n=1 Tax=Parabacteroides sp. FAFU027 TaxID=2922715 RepID=UPI001FAEB594|nr:RHS repeat-associated core domain-containing protein [Parabacteroides sp. FAFU027]
MDDLTLHYANSEKSNQIDWITDARGTQALNNTKEYQDISKATSGEFAYDANGNMTKDLDRNIVAFRYNVLNLPDVIQFRNGNQIRNLYDASGKKLGTEYFTQLTYITPLADGQIKAQSYLAGTVDQNGTAYIGNFEYKTLNGNASLTTLSRIYNDEGYVENLASPQYFYYRRDHLSDDREVWLANTNTVAQRTQYYPSGLPWAYQAGDNPDLQHRKYNGKEFVEMHGYDTYDIVWRQYYPAIMRFQTPDPEVENDYDLSPYTMCHNNMVLKTDPDGRMPQMVAGALIGAALDIAVQSVEIGLSHNKTFSKDFSFGSVVVAAVAGATGVGLASKIGHMSSVAKLAIGAAHDMAASAAGQLAKDGKVSIRKTVVDGLGGRVTGEVVGKIARKFISNSSTAKVLQSASHRLNDHKGSNPLSAKAIDAKTKLTNYVENRTNLAASTASTIVTNSANAAIDKLSKK